MSLPVNEMRTVETPMAVPALENIDKIRLLTDPINRNLQITACYHQLSAAFTSRTGLVANWCTFATWASKQAGVTIRGEDLKRKLEEELTLEPEIRDILSTLSFHSKKLAGETLFKNIEPAALEKLVRTAMQKAGDAVARGNKKVFEEIGMEFARFLAGCMQDEVYKESTINDFCKSLKKKYQHLQYSCIFSLRSFMCRSILYYGCRFPIILSGCFKYSLLSNENLLFILF